MVKPAGARIALVEYHVMTRTIGRALSAAKLLCVGLLGQDGLYWGWGRGRRPPPRRPQGPRAATA
jgi:hypothetical protein